MPEDGSEEGHGASASSTRAATPQASQGLVSRVPNALASLLIPC